MHPFGFGVGNHLSTTKMQITFGHFSAFHLACQQMQTNLQCTDQTNPSRESLREKKIWCDKGQHRTVADRWAFFWWRREDERLQMALLHPRRSDDKETRPGNEESSHNDIFMNSNWTELNPTKLQPHSNQCTIHCITPFNQMDMQFYLSAIW